MIERLPSLRITPATVQQYLGRANVRCANCGQLLRGLRTSHCPECGCWTDVTGRIRQYLIHRRVRRIGHLGTIDGYLLVFKNDRIVRGHRLDARARFSFRKVMSRSRWWLNVLLAILALVGTLISVPLMVDASWRQASCAMLLFIIAAALFIRLGALEDQYRLWLRRGDEVLRFVVYISSPERLEAFAARVNEQCTDDDGIDDVADVASAAVEREGCPQCAYSLRHAPMIARRRSTGGVTTSAVLLMLLGGFVTCCIGMPSLHAAIGVLTLILGVGMFIVAIALMAMRPGQVQRIENPVARAGAMQCPACGFAMPRPSTPPTERHA